MKPTAERERFVIYEADEDGESERVISFFQTMDQVERWMVNKRENKTYDRAECKFVVYRETTLMSVEAQYTIPAFVRPELTFDQVMEYVCNNSQGHRSIEWPDQDISEQMRRDVEEAFWEEMDCCNSCGSICEPHELDENGNCDSCYEDEEEE